jgi:hypothetical protein
MLSRRIFLLGSASLALMPAWALAKKSKQIAAPSGAHTISRQEWPPAIAPDYVAIVDKGYALLSDQLGRLAIVDFKREDGPHVIGELSGVGKKVVDFTAGQHRAYAITSTDAVAESQYSLVTISLTPATDPSIISRQPLPYFSEPTALSVFQDLLCVGGSGLAGENVVVVYNVGGKKRAEDSSQPLATLTFSEPITRLDLQDKLLVVLQSAASTQVDFVSLLNSRNPEKTGSLKLDGSYPFACRSKDSVVLLGQGRDRKLDARAVALKPQPHVVQRLLLPVTEILDGTAQKGQFLVLANQNNRQVVVPLSFAKGGLNLTAGEAVLLPQASRGAISKGRIVAGVKDAYVAADWGGVQVLNIKKNGWQYVYSHTIPRLPAAAVVVSGDHVVLGGADLKVYDISHPDKPLLSDSAELGSTVRALVGVNNKLLALAKDSLSLRQLSRPGDVVSSIKMSGSALAYDASQGRAFVIDATAKATTISPVRVGNQLVAEPVQQLSPGYRKGSACNGLILLAGLNELALFRSDGSREAVSKRVFPNFALRDLYLGPDYALVTAVDQNSQGYLLVVATQKADLPTLASLSLPHDAAALALAGTTAVVVGRSPDGKDVASVVDLTNPVIPKLKSSAPVLEAAAAVAIKDSMAIVAGRGLEILSLG